MTLRLVNLTKAKKKTAKKATKKALKKMAKATCESPTLQGKGKLKSKCCFKWRKKSKACSRCPLAAVIGTKALQQMATRAKAQKLLVKDAEKRRKAA